MRIPIFAVLVTAFTALSILSAGVLFWITFHVLGNTIRELYEDRGDIFAELIAERIDPTLDPATLSREIDQLGSIRGATVFVLDGDGKMVAHPLIGSGVAEPGPPGGIDPIITTVLQGEELRIDKESLRFWRAEIDGVEYGLGLKQLFRPAGWQLGLYVTNPEYTQLQSLGSWLMLTAAGIILVACLVAWVIARAISRPLHNVALVASKIGRFELDYEALPNSRLKEIHETDATLNTMSDSLRWFARYVPRELVRRLMLQPEAQQAEERELTVLFTDLAGFTTMSEAMTPIELTEFVNHHLSLVSKCIDDEGGTVDKYIGDAVMAFFGAPEVLPDHAARACRAAIAIRSAIEQDNAARRERGETAVRVRVGLHTGPVVVGNIGSESRINYSIIGDTVNAAARLESQGKELGDPEAEVVILASDEVIEAGDFRHAAEAVGAFQLRGRTQETQICRL